MTVKPPLVIDLMSDEHNDPHWLSLEARTAGKRQEIYAKNRAAYLDKEIAESKRIKSFKEVIKEQK
jgi:hypothetical protein